MLEWLRLVALILPLAALAPLPAAAQLYDGFDNDNDGQVDEPDEYDGAGLQPGATEVECQMTARPDICLAYFQINCQTYGFPLACQMAALGQSCQGGDPGQCQVFVQILQANSACLRGDPSACAWLQSQGLGG